MMTNMSLLDEYGDMRLDVDNMSYEVVKCSINIRLGLCLDHGHVKGFIKEKENDRKIREMTLSSSLHYLPIFSFTSFHVPP